MIGGGVAARNRRGQKTLRASGFKRGGGKEICELWRKKTKALAAVELAEQERGFGHFDRWGEKKRLWGFGSTFLADKWVISELRGENAKA